MRLKGRQRAVRAVIDDVRAWAAERDDVQAVVLVGSYARRAERMGSDVDLMVLTDDPDRLADSGWFDVLRPGARLIRAMRWGPSEREGCDCGRGFRSSLASHRSAGLLFHSMQAHGEF